MKVLVVAGSSGGHIFPALALLDYIKQNYTRADTQLVLSRRNVKKFPPRLWRGIKTSSSKFLWGGTLAKNGVFDTFLYPKKDIEASGFKVAYIDSVFLETKINYRNLLAIFKFLKGSWQSLIIILRFEPDVVVGFGSITSVPLVMFSWLMRLKVVLHEQNVIPGKANRFLAKFCDRIAVSFGQTREYLKGCPNKIVFTGNPLRGNLTRVDKKKCREFFDLEESKVTILVMGGSQGSLRINRGFLKALAALPGRQNLQVIHLAGFRDEAKLDQEYSGIGVRARIFPFLNEMEYALSLADLAVCRAGATSIQELIYYRLPAILLPYPFAYQHQMANARVLSERGAAVILEDKELDSDKLRCILEEILGNSQNLEKMRSGYDSLKPGESEAAKQLAELVMDRNIGHG